MQTQHMSERSTIIVVLHADKKTCTVEFSHRGEVKDIQEFNLHSEQMGSKVTVHADRLGFVYRISHKKEPGLGDDRVQMYKVREAPANKVITQ